MIINTNKKRIYKGYYYYVLQLEQGKYYVGLTHNINKRFKQHKEGDGAEWTKLYKPIKLLTCKETGSYTYREAGQVENQITLKMMRKYGRENVRGGRYCAVDQAILDQIMGIKLSKKIDDAFKRNTLKKRSGKKKSGKTTALGYNKIIGFGENELPFFGYKIKEYRVGQHFHEKNWIKTKFLLNGEMVVVKVVHDTKTIWVSEQTMNKYGADKIIDRIRQNGN